MLLDTIRDRAVMGQTWECRAEVHFTSCWDGSSMWQWLVLSHVTVIINLLIRLRPRVGQEATCTKQESEMRAEPLRVNHLCPG